MKFCNISQSLIALINILVGSVSFALIYREFGASKQTDSYFLAINSMSIGFLVLDLFTAQYPFYFRKIIHNEEALKKYFNSMIQSMIILSGILSLLLIIIIPNLISEMVRIGLMSDSYGKCIKYLSIAFVIYLPWNIIQYTMSSKGEIAKSYLLLLIPNLSVVIYILFTSILHLPLLIENIALVYAISFFISFIVGVFWCKDIILLKLSIDKESVINTMKTSFKVRSSSNIHNIIFNLLLISILSKFKDGMASVFYLSKKIADVLISVIFGPTSKRVQNEIVDLISSKQLHKVSTVIRKANLYYLIFNLLSIVIIILSSELILDFSNVGSQHYHNFIICIIFLALSNSLICLEGGYHAVNQYYGDYITIITANLTFIFIFGLSSLMTKNESKLILLVGAITLGQLSVLIIHYFSFRRKIYEKLKETM